MLASLLVLQAALAVQLPLAAAVTTVSLSPVSGRSDAHFKGAPDAGRARVAFQKERAARLAGFAEGPTTIPATNLAYVQYTANIGVGSPATYYNIVVDTGSSNTFVGYARLDARSPAGAVQSDPAA